MATTRKDEARALSDDERELVGQSRHPALQELSDVAVFDLVKLMRQRRDKARTQADQRRREMRGKAAARGATPSKADEGSRLKAAVLAAAMRRLNSEADRRRRMGARAALVASANKALAMKRQAETATAPEHNSRHAHQGMRRKENPRAPDLIRPGERGTPAQGRCRCTGEARRALTICPALRTTSRHGRRTARHSIVSQPQDDVVVMRR